MTRFPSSHDQSVFFHADAHSALGPNGHEHTAIDTAESREYDRVSADDSDPTTSVGDERDCPILDVSPVGLSAVTHDPHKVGEVFSAMLEYGGRMFTGEACVQNVTVLDDGRVHCGLLCTEDPICVGGLTTALGLIAITAHHEL